MCKKLVLFAHKPKKSWLDKKKGFTCRKTGFVWKKVWGKVPSQEKKVLCYKKTGIVKAKKYKNRIYLRKKGDDKNRKKKDFFPPLTYCIKKYFSPLE